jgi:hypothetical protein
VSDRSAKATKRRAAPVKASPATMDLDRFWGIIEKSRRGAADAEAQGERLIALLEQLGVEEVIAFDRILQERIRNDLWAVAYCRDAHIANQ